MKTFNKVLISINGTTSVIETTPMSFNDIKLYVKSLGHQNLRILRVWNGVIGSNNVGELQTTKSNLVLTTMEKGGLRKLKVA